MQGHETSVYRYCREALRDRALAEDVQQQVFMSAFRDLPKFSGRSPVRTWLFAIARHRVLDAAKSRRRARSHVEFTALADLMQGYGTSVYRYCREALRDRALAEDVQQQVFMSAFRDLPKFSGRSPVRTWLFAIARHRVLDAAKSRRRARSHVEGEDAADIPERSSSRRAAR